jgi:hypothetical protein
MRTAEEILNSVLDGAAVLNRQDAIDAINKSRIELLQECAEKMDMIYWDGFNKVGKPTNYFMSGADNVQPNRNGLLSLIDEVK